METESSQSEAQAISAGGSTSDYNKSKHGNAWNESKTVDEASCTSISSKQENMMENLQDRLTTMRDGFLER